MALWLSGPLLCLDAPKGAHQLYRQVIQHASDTTHLAWGLVIQHTNPFTLNRSTIELVRDSWSTYEWSSLFELLILVDVKSFYYMEYFGEGSQPRKEEGGRVSENRICLWVLKYPLSNSRFTK